MDTVDGVDYGSLTIVQYAAGRESDVFLHCSFNEREERSFVNRERVVQERRERIESKEKIRSG